MHDTSTSPSNPPLDVRAGHLIEIETEPRPLNNRGHPPHAEQSNMVSGREWGLHSRGLNRDSRNQYHCPVVPAIQTNYR